MIYGTHNSKIKIQIIIINTLSYLKLLKYKTKEYITEHYFS